MAKRNTDPQTLRTVLGSFVEKNKLQKGIDKIDVAQAWMEIMGPAIAKYTIGIKLDGKRLIVSLGSSVLREELGYGKEKIIKNLNEHLGRDVVEKLMLR